AAFAADFFEEFGADTERHAEVQSFEGLTQIIFGENFCSGVPFSRVAPGDVLEYGEPQTTTQVFEAAVESFEAAITVAQAAGSADQEYFARVGLGRALLNLGRFAEAAAAVASVPTDFDYRLAYSENTARQNNGVWVYNNSAGIYSVADNEGGNGLPFRSRGDVDGSIRDPRIPVEHVGLAQLGTARPEEHWAQLKFPTRASSITIASGVEARLIEAEAALNAGPAGLDDFESIHDEIRGGVGLPSLADQYGDLSAMTQDERVDVHFAERAYWLYLTSHRLGDLRRLLWDYGRAADEVFPSG